MTLPFTVLVDDNFHHQDEDERYEFGQYHTYDAALAAAIKLVEASLFHLFRPGMTADELYDHYTSFGEDPFIRPQPEDQERFSAWTYAKARCAEICTTPDQ